MADMTAATHKLVDTKLRQAAEAIETAQPDAKVKKAATPFAMAVRTIYECRTAIDADMDTDAVLGHLESAAVTLAQQFDSGEASSSVRAAIRSIKELVELVKKK
jgi:hypothetical protein